MSIQYLLPGLELTTFYYESPPVTTRQGLRPKDFFTRSFPASRGGAGGVTVFNPTLEDYHCAKFCRDRSGSFGFLYTYTKDPRFIEWRSSQTIHKKLIFKIHQSAKSV